MTDLAEIWWCITIGNFNAGSNPHTLTHRCHHKTTFNIINGPTKQRTIASGYMLVISALPRHWNVIAKPARNLCRPCTSGQHHIIGGIVDITIAEYVPACRIVTLQAGYITSIYRATGRDKQRNIGISQICRTSDGAGVIHQCRLVIDWRKCRFHLPNFLFGINAEIHSNRAHQRHFLLITGKSCRGTKQLQPPAANTQKISDPSIGNPVFMLVQ